MICNLMKLNLFNKHNISSAAMWGLGDYISQKTFRQKHKNYFIKHDWNRTANHVAFGGLFVGPLGSVWYKALDNHVSRTFKDKTALFVAYKVLLDTLICGPCLTAGYMVATTKKNRLVETFKEKYVATVLFESAYWPLFDIINFKFISVNRQLVFMNTISLLDTCLLSCIVHSFENAYIDT